MSVTKLSIAQAGTFKLDGGAMYGVVPKSLWQKLNPADENNLCTWALRSLIVEREGRVILIDTGMGNKQDEKFFGHYAPQGDDIIAAVKKAGYQPDQITDVLLTHFHFDHVGGALMKNRSGKVEPSFPNATYWSNQKHYDWAFTPNARERASFLKENFVPLQEEGILKMIDDAGSGEIVDWIADIQMVYVYGHTEAQMLPIIPYGDSKMIYCADLIPSSGHIGMPYVMAYDMRPLLTMEEKDQILRMALEKDFYLFFEHDPIVAACKVSSDAKGRIVKGAVIDQF
jgi:glyoxylase-like metal-dependent hydrolase (beta-lactamase superfamily II)